MTRKSKRELERAVDGLDGGGVSDLPEAILYRDLATGTLRDGDGDVVPPEEADPLAIIETEAP